MIFDDLEVIPFLNRNVRKSVETVSPGKELLVYEVPGFTKDDLQLTIDGYVLRINGRKEIYGKTHDIDQKVVLPMDSLDSTTPITAKVENGILAITLKKTKKQRQTKIEIS
jgi:HSP20 family molecular chaperone IbpA